MSHTTESSFSSGLRLSGLGTASSLGFLFAETVVAVRILDPRDYGVFVLLVAMVNFFTMAADLGMRTSVTQLLARRKSGKPVVVSTALAFRVAVLAVLSLTIWLATPPVLAWIAPGNRGLDALVRWLPAMLIGASLDELLTGIAQGLRAFRLLAIAQFLRGALRFGLTALFLIVWELGTLGLIYSWIIAFALSVVVLWFSVPGARSFDRTCLTELLRFGVPVQGSRLLWFLGGKADVLILGALLGPTRLAMFAVAKRIPEALLRAGESFTAVYFPTVTSLLGTGKTAGAERLLRRSIRLLSILGGTAALSAVVFGDRVMALLFGDAYAASGFVFGLLMLALHMTLLVNLMGYTLTAAGHPSRSLVENIARSLVSIVGNLTLIPIAGISGAGFAAIAAPYTATPLAVWLLKRSNVTADVAALVKPTLLLALFCSTFWWFAPEGLVVRLAFVAAFVVANVAVAAVTRDDLLLLFPRRAGAGSQ